MSFNFFVFSFELLLPFSSEICVQFYQVLSTPSLKKTKFLQHAFSCEFQPRKNLEKIVKDLNDLKKLNANNNQI